MQIRFATSAGSRAGFSGGPGYRGCPDSSADVAKGKIRAIGSAPQPSFFILKKRKKKKRNPRLEQMVPGTHHMYVEGSKWGKSAVGNPGDPSIAIRGFSSPFELVLWI